MVAELDPQDTLWARLKDYMEVWRRGYGLLDDKDGDLYVYQTAYES